MLPEDADVLAPSCDVAGLGTPLALVGPRVLVGFGVPFDVADMLVCKDGDGPSSFLGKFMSVHKASLNQNNCSSIATNRLSTYEDLFINVQVWNQNYFSINYVLTVLLCNRCPISLIMFLCCVAL